MRMRRSRRGRVRGDEDEKIEARVRRGSELRDAGMGLRRGRRKIATTTPTPEHNDGDAIFEPTSGDSNPTTVELNGGYSNPMTARPLPTHRAVPTASSRTEDQRRKGRFSFIYLHKPSYKPKEGLPSL
jgi:hypothetical protein